MDERRRLDRVFRIANRALGETSRDPEVVARAAWDALREIEKLASAGGEGEPTPSPLTLKERVSDGPG